jgi:hypothetical protein
MEEVSGSSRDFDFVETELRFFGHDSYQIHFGYPQKYHDEIGKALQETKQALDELEVRRQHLIEAGDTTSYDARRLVPEESYENEKRYLSRHFTGGTKHRWYELRFRGRYGDEDMELRHPEASRYLGGNEPSLFGSSEPKIGPPPPKPSTEQFAAYLNDHIVSNAWSHGVSRAQLWHDSLDEADPDREVAANYIGFLGNIIVHEYCRTAIALAANSLANDDFVSSKHFMTVCWPYVEYLDQYIPDEVKNTKQVLREVFLQMTVRGHSMRTDMERFGLLSEEDRASFDMDDRAAYEDRAVSHVMYFGEMDQEERTKYVTKVSQAADNLIERKMWYRAIDLLDLARRAFNLPHDEIQQKIDAIAMAGVQELTSDVSALYDEYYAEDDDDGYGFSINREHGAYQLTFAPGLSQEMRAKLDDVRESRLLEYHVHKFQADIADPSVDTHKTTSALIYNFRTVQPDKIKRFIDAEKAQYIKDFYMSPQLTDVTAVEYDDLTGSLVLFAFCEVLTPEERNECLATMLDSLHARISEDAEYTNGFQKLVGILSALVAKSSVPDSVEDEVVWRVVSKKQVEQVMEVCLQRDKEQYGGDADGHIEKYQKLLLEDLRDGLKKYWAEIDEYF